MDTAPSRLEVLNELERALRAWIKDPSWKTFQPVSRALKRLEETPEQVGIRE